MAVEEQNGIKVAGVFYPFPPSLRIGESRVIRKLTNLNPSQFQKALERLDKEDNPDVGLALVWWCVHRANPNVTLDDLEELEWSQIGEPDKLGAAEIDTDPLGREGSETPGQPPNEPQTDDETPGDTPT